MATVLQAQRFVGSQPEKRLVDQHRRRQRVIAIAIAALGQLVQLCVQHREYPFELLWIAIPREGEQAGDLAHCVHRQHCIELRY